MQIGFGESKYGVTGDPPPNLQVVKGSRGLLLKLWDFLHIWEKVKPKKLQILRAY